MDQSTLSTLPLDPPVPAFQDSTEAVSGERLSYVEMWCTSGFGDTPPHWITSYTFANPVPTNRERSLGGVSLDMHQPQNHVYHRPSESNTNYFGSLAMSTRFFGAVRSANTPLAITAVFDTAVTVQDVRDVVTTRGLQYYKFHPDGSGCMFWQLTLLQEFVTRGWIKVSDMSALTGQIERHAKTWTRSKILYPPIQGEFYNPPTES